MCQKKKNRYLSGFFNKVRLLIYLCLLCSILYFTKFHRNYNWLINFTFSTHFSDFRRSISITYTTNLRTGKKSNIGMCYI